MLRERFSRVSITRTRKMQSKLFKFAVSIAAVAIIALPISADAQVRSSSKKAPVKKVAAKKTVKKAPAKKPNTKVVLSAAEIKAREIQAIANKPMTGTWYLLSGDQKVKSTRITFTPDGAFMFVGSNFKSRGIYSFSDTEITLTWLTVDDQPVKAGTMKKSFPLSRETHTLQIDKFTYAKDGN
jgi:hypothetical protein